MILVCYVMLIIEYAIIIGYSTLYCNVIVYHMF